MKWGSLDGNRDRIIAILRGNKKKYIYSETLSTEQEVPVFSPSLYECYVLLPVLS